MKFSHMSLSRRLLVCFSLLAIIPVLLGGVSIWQNQSMQSRVNHLNDTALPQVIEANHIIDNSNLVTNSLQSMLLLDSEALVREARNKAKLAAESNAEILLGTRSVMEFLLSPVRKAWHEAGRER